MGKYKWKELCMPYALEDIDPPTDKEVADAKAIFGLT
jgi:hypothetical protein